MDLYSAKNSCGFAALICLEEIGADYTIYLLDLAAGEQRLGTYLSVNPHGMVPALVVDSEVITELGAVLTYIASIDREQRLIPRAPIPRAKVYETLSWFSTTVHVALAQVFRGERFSDDLSARESVAKCGRARFERALGDFEAMAARGHGWLVGESFTPVDAVSLVTWRWAERLG